MAASCYGCEYVTSIVGPVGGCWWVRTSEIPFLLWRRQRTVHAILRGFLRWRKSDSDLPFWKRKILLSERTKSLPCDVYVSTSAEHICDRCPIQESRSMRLGVDPCRWHVPPLSLLQQRISSGDNTCMWPSVHFHACLSYASTVLPVCDSETGEGTAMCAYPAGIDLATGEGVFVSPHGCRYVVDIRSMSSSRGHSASRLCWREFRLLPHGAKI